MTQTGMQHLRLLGPVRIDQVKKVHSETLENAEGTVPRFRSQRTLGLLGYLASEQRPIGRAHLAVLLWPDEPSSKGRANLSRELHNLAQILPDCWELNRQSVAFLPSDNTIVDLYQLSQLEAQERWGEAAELLGGEFLEGLNLNHNLEFENWLLGERERWRGFAEGILRHVIDAHQRRGRYSEALQQAQRLLQLAPWDEDTHRQVICLLAWTGQRGAALRQFEICQRALRDELDVEPAAETVTLYKQIKSGKLDLPPQLPVYLTAEKARRQFEPPRFVAREGELVQLDAFLEAALAGRGGVIFITGSPGCGKTALLHSFSQRAMDMYPNLLVASGKCNAYSGVGDPYLPFRDVMAMLTADVEGMWDAGTISRDHANRLWAVFPLVVQVLVEYGSQLLEIFVSGSALLSRFERAGQNDSPWLPRLVELVKHQQRNLARLEQSHLFQQVTNVFLHLARNEPLLLVLDDFQWADTASIGLLFHLGRRLAEMDSRLLIACAYRSEEVALGRNGERHPLAKVLNEFKCIFGDVWVKLDQIARVEERRFVDALLDIEPNRFGESFRAPLFERTGGHPLFTVELLRAMSERGDLYRDSEGVWNVGSTLDWDVLPARVAAVIEERIDRVEPELQELLSVASVEGEVFTAQVLAEVRNIPERMVLHWLSQDLEQRHSLVREQDETFTDQRRMSRYRFSHILFQDYIYKQLSQGEQRILHGDVAAALENLYTGHLDEMAIQIAQHFYQADDRKNAFYYFSLAGDRAAYLYESAEAVSLYTRAIQLSEWVSPFAASLTKLYRGRGLAFERLGEFDRALSDYTETLQIARSAGELQLEWRALIDLGKLWRSRDYNKARDYYEAGLDLARLMNDPAVLATNLNWVGNWYANGENPLKAVECHREALKIVESYKNRQELANTLDLLGIANLLGGDLNASTRYYNRAIRLFREMDDRARLTTSLMGRASIVSALVWLASVPAVPTPAATSDVDEALRIATEIDSPPDQAWACYALGMLHILHGNLGLALEVVRSGLRISTEIGHREFVVACQSDLGLVYAELFLLDQAQEQLEEALAMARELHSATMIHLVCGELARAYLMQDKFMKAKTCLDTVISAQTPMDTLGKRLCWTSRAELALTQGDPKKALEIVERLIASAPGIRSGDVITFLWLLKGKVLAALGHLKEAKTLMCMALENAQTNDERFLLWRVHASLGRLYEAMDQQAEAEDEFSAAEALVAELASTIPDEGLRNNYLQGARRNLRVSPK